MDLGVYINPDEIASALEGSDEERARAAQAEAEARRQACLAARESFSFETVMSHPSKVEILRQARDAGFATALYFVSTEAADLNVARVRQRVALGGHPVPEDRIISRYARTMSLLPAAIDVADRVLLFDNSYRFAPAGPVLLRPFLLLERGTDGVVQVSPPIPEWGRASVEMARRQSPGSG